MNGVKMPSTVTVPVAVVDAVLPHSNADRLEIVHVLGWQCCVPIGKYEPGDAVMYFAPDLVLPDKLVDELGVAGYLKKGNRVRSVRLRGEKSFGIVADVPAGKWAVGDNLAEHLGVKKWEPPLRGGAMRDARRSPTLKELEGFPKYTHIENARYYPTLIGEDEQIVVTEKIHGTNSRVGLVNGEWVAGSHNVRRVRPFGFLIAGERDTVWKRLGRKLAVWVNWLHGKIVGALPWRRMRRWLRWRPLVTDGRDLYWSPLFDEKIVGLLRELASLYGRVALYGEIYGPDIQPLTYGVPKGETRHVAFDIKVDGRYLDWPEFREWCTKHEIPHVPVLYEGVRHLVNFAAMSEGQSVLGGDHMREGVVVKPVKERNDPRLGRVVLKYVSDTYLLDGKEERADPSERGES